MMRRTLVLLTLAPALGAQQLDRYLTALAERCWQARAAAVAAIRTPAEVAARQRYIRATMLDEIGGFPEKTPLNARITGVLRRSGYRVEKLIFESRPGFYVTANVYVPDGAGPFAAVLGTAGHSDSGKAYPLYQRAWIGLVKRGFLVIAYDPPAQGERLEYAYLRPGVPQHIMAGEQCLLAGSNIAAYEIWDGIRAVDYLLTRPDVDPKKIAVVGNSGGGTQSAYLAVFEPRLAAAVPSCYITSWEKLWAGPGPQDSEQVFANFLRDELDFGDFLIAFAPKPIQMLAAIKDFFPIEGARATFAEARRIFEVAGAAGKVGYFEYDDPHGWSKPRREATYRWLEKWLHGREDDGVEAEFDTEPEGELQCHPPKGETVYSLNRAFAERIYPQRAAARLQDPAALRALVARRLALPSARGVPPLSEDGAAIVLETEPGIAVRGLVSVPPEGPARKPATIVLDPAGAPATLPDQIVFSLTVRGWGEAAPQAGKSGYTADYQTAMRAILVGKNLPGMQVYDVLRAFDYLAARPGVDPERISLLGRGSGAVLALLAAAVEPRFHQVRLESPLPSYLAIVRAPLHENTEAILIPGVLRDFDLPDLTPIVPLVR